MCGQALAPQQGHPRHWDRIDACTRAQEEAQDGMYRRPWRVKDETLTLKGSREEQSRADNTLICAFVYVFHLYCDVILFGDSSRYTVRDGVSMLRETFAGALPAHPARM